METVHSRLAGREYFLNRDTLRIDLEEATGMSEIPDFVRDIVWEEVVNDLHNNNTAFSQACEIISNYEKTARLVLLLLK
jgi:hypothetical protein